MFGIDDKPSICIADLPYGCKVRVTWEGQVLEGTVRHNYGASFALRTEEKIVIICNDIPFIEILGKESMDLFEIQVAKNHAEHRQFVEKLFSDKS